MRLTYRVVESAQGSSRPPSRPPSRPRPGQRLRPSGLALCRLRACLLVVAAGVAGAVGVAGCSSGPSESDCERLRDKLVELEFVAMGAKALTTEARAELAKQKQETSEGVAARFKASCVDKTPKELVDCALGATSLAQVQQCDLQK